MTKAGLGAFLLSAFALSFTSGCVPEPPPASPASATAIDFTKPAAARAMLAELAGYADSQTALMVEVTKHSVALSVLKDMQPRTYTYRDGKIEEVQTDMAYVDQATFDTSDFNLDNVGALFRAAGAISGSEQNQRLQVVDYSSGRVMMSVSTNPESKTVFFNQDGSLLKLLNFDTLGGIKEGIAEVCGTLNEAYEVGITSDQMAYVDFPGSDEGTVVRRQRTQRVPVTTITRSENTSAEPFSPKRIHPEVIWQVVDSHLGVKDTPADAQWQVRVVRGTSQEPVMRFTIGSNEILTDLAGKMVTG
jgi:hypothetical protein